MPIDAAADDLRRRRHVQQQVDAVRAGRQAARTAFAGGMAGRALQATPLDRAGSESTPLTGLSAIMRQASVQVSAVMTIPAGGGFVTWQESDDGLGGPHGWPIELGVPWLELPFTGRVEAEWRGEWQHERDGNGPISPARPYRIVGQVQTHIVRAGTTIDVLRHDLGETFLSQPSAVWDWDTSWIGGGQADQVKLWVPNPSGYPQVLRVHGRIEVEQSAIDVAPPPCLWHADGWIDFLPSGARTGLDLVSVAPVGDGRIIAVWTDGSSISQGYAPSITELIGGDHSVVFDRTLRSNTSNGLSAWVSSGAGVLWLVTCESDGSGNDFGTRIFRSTDGGESWDEVYSLIRTPDYPVGRRQEIAGGVTELASGTLLAAGGWPHLGVVDGWRGGIYRSTDGGDTWNVVDDWGVGPGGAVAGTYVEYSPRQFVAHGGEIWGIGWGDYAGGRMVTMRSSDDGATWSTFTTNSVPYHGTTMIRACGAILASSSNTHPVVVDSPADLPSASPSFETPGIGALGGIDQIARIDGILIAAGRSGLVWSL